MWPISSVVISNVLTVSFHIAPVYTVSAPNPILVMVDLPAREVFSFLLIVTKLSTWLFFLSELHLCCLILDFNTFIRKKNFNGGRPSGFVQYLGVVHNHHHITSESSFWRITIAFFGFISGFFLLMFVPSICLIICCIN